MTLNLPFTRCRWFRAAACVLIGATLTGTAWAQTTPATEAELLARGWNAIVRADIQQAQATARLLRQVSGADRSSAVLAFIVEVGIRAGGPEGGLTAYEEWIGNRSLENGYALRPVAYATLRGVMGGPAGRARSEARQALAADGDQAAAAEINSAIERGDRTETAIAASGGNRTAVDRLVAEVTSNPQVRTPVVDALGESGDAGAVRNVIPLLQSDRDDLQVAAARALGKAQVSDAVPPLRALLNDPRFHVKFAAASALFRLGDDSGFSLLQEALKSPHSAIRASAAEATSSRPTAEWLALVRELSRDTDPQVRATAAQLLAPHDAEAAATVVKGLLEDPNPAIRELAGWNASEQETDDLRTLRQMLRNRDALVRVRAAASIFRLTR